MSNPIAEVTVYGPTTDPAEPGWRVEVNQRPANRVTEPTHGPLMIEHPAVNLARPTSLWDIQARLWGFGLDKPGAQFGDYRFVPVNRDFARLLHTLSDRDEWEWVHYTDLHREALTPANRWRGRPSAFLQFGHDTLRDWRDKVFEGRITIREVARRAQVSYKAAERFAHAEICWWV